MEDPEIEDHSLPINHNLPLEKPTMPVTRQRTTRKSSKAPVRRGSDESRSADTDSSNAVKGTKIVRNYAKALCSFAYSEMAVPYLLIIIKENFPGQVELDEFQKCIKDKKGKTASIPSLRKLLMEEDKDNSKERAYKRMFTEISIIFIKFFAVNWIFSGKVKYRLEHLKYRHKMLRRIRNPEFFTYLKSTGN